MADTYVHRLAYEYNARMTRTDIEWAVGANGELYLRDKPSWTARHTTDLARQAEDDRNRWKRSQPPEGE